MNPKIVSCLYFSCILQFNIKNEYTSIIFTQVLLLVVLIAFVCGAPQEKRGRYFEKAESGDYRYGYGTRNGDNVEQEATIKLGPVLEDGTQNMIPVVRGSYSFVDNFGNFI